MAVPFAEVRSLSAEVEVVLLEVLPKCTSTGGLLFRLGVAGYDAQAGELQPTGGRRRY
jgi:hypothetical protein